MTLRPLPVFTVLALIVAPAPVWSQNLTQTQTPAPKPAATPTVSDVIVVAPNNPKVVSSYPAEGATVASGTMVLKLVFDQKMTPEAWSYGPIPVAVFPNCLARPRLLTDGRTVVLLCSLPAGKAYGLQVNGAPGFVSDIGRAADPFVLHFTTSNDHVVDMDEALTQAGLKPWDNPIMDWTGKAGVSNQPPPPRAP